MSSISNAIVLIQKVIDHQAEGINFTTLNKDTGIPQGSAHRIVKELVSLRVLEYDATSKTYRGGLLLASIGAQVLTHYDIRKSARHSLELLHKDLGHVVTLGILDDITGIYIDKLETPDMGLRLHSEVGKAFPLHCTAMGKVLLAYAPEKLQSKILRRKLSSYTPHTITEANTLKRELNDVKENGYALDDEEITRGLVCTAAPIISFDGTIKAALSFTCQKHFFQETGPEVIIEKVINAAKLASA